MGKWPLDLVVPPFRRGQGPGYTFGQHVASFAAPLCLESASYNGEQEVVALRVTNGQA